jgi:hypothetical protein
MSTECVLRLDEIVVDDSLDPRVDGLREEHVQALMESADTWPPILVAQLPSGPTLIEGRHRCEAATRLGREAICATIIDPPLDGDYLRLAFEANARHGLPPSLADRKAYASTLLRTHPEYSDREIGRLSGLNHETVGSLRHRTSSYRFPERKPGELPETIGLLDPIRRAKATKVQKAVAGYVQRLATALGDPYEADSSLNEWPDDPAEVACACYAAMGESRAARVLADLEADAHFILQVAKARKSINGKENTK